MRDLSTTDTSFGMCFNFSIDWVSQSKPHYRWRSNVEKLYEGHAIAPDAEVVLRVDGLEVAICAFFKGEDGWSVDILTGIDDESNAVPYAALFTSSGDALRHADWKYHNGVPHDDPPF